MKANYTVTIRFNIHQDIDEFTDVLDLHLIAHTAADAVVDLVTDENTVADYEILSKKVKMK